MCFLGGSEAGMYTIYHLYPEAFLYLVKVVTSEFSISAIFKKIEKNIASKSRDSINLGFNSNYINCKKMCWHYWGFENE